MAKIWLIVIGVVAALGLLALMIFLTGNIGTTALVMGVCLVGVGFVVGTYIAILKFLQKKKGTSFLKQLGGSGSAAAEGNIEGMRNTFNEGLEKIRGSKENIAALPWYIIAGEAGSGKTEAVRRCHPESDFISGLTDYSQGMGGTRNMHWWFTYQGVILDTAGRIFTEDVEEWQEFLQLLKKARKNEPINGFILAIPTDTLIRESADVIEKRASHIAKQLQVIKDSLDVRFPVWVVITKSDLIPGFREFVKDFNDPEFQYQMIGWSNPDSLDEPFDPSKVDECMDQLVNKLRMRTRTMLLDPTPRESIKRLDEVDNFFVFPNELRTIFPRLRQYLEIIFSNNQRSDKFLFFRGIYLTSSLQEGAALDKVVASALGGTLNDLPGGGFRRETTYFLRDPFYKKIYKERKLVTASKKVKGLTFRRKLALGVASLVSMGAVLGFGFYGAKSFQEAIGTQRDYWTYAADPERWSKGGDDTVDYWSPPIAYDEEVGFLFTSYQDVEGSIKGGTQTFTLVEFHQKLFELSREAITVPAIFKPLSAFDMLFSDEGNNRLRAQRIVYDYGVVRPLISLTRERLSGADYPWSESMREAMLRMVDLEVAHAAATAPEGKPVEVTEGYGQEFLNPLMTFTTEKPLEPEILTIFDQVYSVQPAAEVETQAALWPPTAISAGTSLEQNLPIKAALDKFTKHVEKLKQRPLEMTERIRSLMTRVEALDNFEQQTLSSLQQTTGTSGLEAASLSIEKLNTDFADLEGELDKIAEETGEDLQATNLEQIYNKMLDNARKEVETNVTQIQEQLDLQLPEGGGPAQIPLIEEIRAAILGTKQELTSSLDAVFAAEDLERLRSFDGLFFNPAGESKAAVAKTRIGLYDEALKAASRMSLIKSGLIGNLAERVQTVDNEQSTALGKLAAFEGSRSGEAETSLSQLLTSAASSARATLLSKYEQEVRDATLQRIGYPLDASSTRPLTAEDIDALLKLHQQVKADLQAPSLTRNADAQTLFRRLDDRFTKISDALGWFYVVGEKRMATVNVVLPAYDAALRMISTNTDVSSSNALANWINWNYRFVTLASQAKRRLATGESRRAISMDINHPSFLAQFSSVIDGRDADGPSFSVDEAWGLLKMLTRYNARPKNDGKLWQFAVPVQMPGGGQSYFPFLLEFEQPVPPPASWPTLADFQLP